MIYDGRYQVVLNACQDMVRRRDRLAKPALHDLLMSRVDPSLPNDTLFAHIFAESLLRRIDRNLVVRKNIYLETFEVSQLELFYLMCRAYPQVAQGHAIANQLLAAELRQHKRATLLEIGIGKGMQVARLFTELSQNPGQLEELHLFAIDPDPDNLRSAEALLSRLPVVTGLRWFVHPIASLLENLPQEVLDQIAGQTPGHVVVNAAYTLHHTMHPLNQTDARTQILARLQQHLRPRLVTFVEPSSDHDTENLLKRLTACWEHFGTVFDLVDRADMEPEKKFAIKETFFGREIRDIFGTADAFRCERHERCESWLLRLAKAGFVPYESDLRLQIHMPDHCTVTLSKGLTRLGFHNTVLIAIFAYQSGMYS